MSALDALLARQPVIPVVVLETLSEAVPLAEALVAGGLPVIEVTLRTPVALDAIAAMAEVEGAIVGAGTVRNPEMFDRALLAGARFLVAPGLTERLARHASERAVPFLPGVATASEILAGLDHGFTRFKFFPAMAAGGLPALAALAAVFPELRFCPTGGITAATAPDWLAHPAVACVGGSWLVPKGPLDPGAVTRLARAAAALRDAGAPGAAG